MDWFKWFCVILFLGLSGCYDMSYPDISPDSMTYLIAWPWNSQTVYVIGDCVTMPQIITGKGPIYKNLKDNNQNIEPPTVIVTEDYIYGKPGEQLPSYCPAPNWPEWWERIR
jgi:hypothetical protein